MKGLLNSKSMSSSDTSTMTMFVEKETCWRRASHGYPEKTAYSGDEAAIILLVAELGLVLWAHKFCRYCAHAQFAYFSMHFKCCNLPAGGQDKLQAHVMKLTFHGIVHRDIQEVCGSSRLLTALVLKFAGAHWGAVTLLTSSLTLNT